MRIPVEVKSTEGLSRTFYEFTLYESMSCAPKVILNMYAKQTRETRRHGWKNERNQLWDRLNKRKSTMEAPPEPPKEVIEEALNIVRNAITYKARG